MFGHVEDTPYDVQFSVFGISVRVHPGFWLMGLIMGSGLSRMDRILIWLSCLFVSILVHELGHALVAKSYGWPVYIKLHWMGGTAHPTPHRGYTRNRSMWMSFAGPLAGFILYGIVLAVEVAMTAAAQTQESIRLMFKGDSPIEFAFMQLEWINLAWGFINLLPVYPLDGGQICAEFLNARSSRQAQYRTHQIGMIVGGIVALMFFQAHQIQSGILFAALAVMNYQNAEACRRY